MTTQKNNNSIQERRALIYCRVSSVKQRIEGSGLESQEQRCREYAASKGYEVVAVFPDDVSGGGDFMNRPGMCALLAFLDAQKGEEFVVIFDDLKRFARDTEFHIKLRREFDLRGAKIECLNFRFEDTPEGKFIETIIAAQGELEREQNRRQVVQKMKARVEKGYWVFRAPVGYKHVPCKSGGGKVLVRDEPVASVVQEALQGFADGRFNSQAEVQRFLEASPHFPKDLPDGGLRPMTVPRLLKKVVYAGYVEAPKWEVSLRKGVHEPLISFETHERILQHLEGRRRPAARKDFAEDFPLRGFVCCNSCGNPMTAYWAKGCRKHYAYYHCGTRGCPEKSKPIPVRKIDEGFSDILQSLRPGRKLMDVAEHMVRSAWAKRVESASEAKEAIKRQLLDANKKIESVLDRIVEASAPSVISAYETRLQSLEREKIVLSERLENTVPPQGRLEECIELSLRFLSNPWNIYEKGCYAVKQTVLRLAFVEPLAYCRNDGYRTPEISFPFKALSEKNDVREMMVLLERIELSTSPLPRARPGVWVHLAQSCAV
ncbi:MAG: recombinase family protein [Pseudomonadota bacterium]